MLLLATKQCVIYRTFKKRRRRKRSLVGRNLRSFIQKLKRYAFSPIIFHSILYSLWLGHNYLMYIYGQCTEDNLPLELLISFQFRSIQSAWRVLFGRARTYARTSFGTRSRYIDSNRLHLRNNSFIRNLKRCVKFVCLIYLLNKHNYYSQH